MFTSRSEFRLHLRPDNADLRLTPKAKMVGCASDLRVQKFDRNNEIFQRCVEILKKDVRPMNQWKENLGLKTNKYEPKSAWEILGQYNFRSDLKSFQYEHNVIKEAVQSRELNFKIQTEARYEKFVNEQKSEIDEIRKDEQLEIPTDIDYINLENLNLSNEEREKLELSKPSTIAAASRIPGVTPNAVLALLRFVRKKKSSNIVFTEVNIP